MKHDLAIQVGPRSFRIGSAWRLPIATLQDLYRDYPRPEIVQHSVRLEPVSPLRRWFRPSVRIEGGYTLADAAPLPLDQAMLAAEMGMNLQLALGERQLLLLHASSVERNGRVLIMTGESGSGKSTLAAVLMTQGWRLLGDEFALIDPATGLAWPFPRPISLKNASAAILTDYAPEGRFGTWMRGTPKGDIRHLMPDKRSIAAMHMPARPALILFPSFGHEAAIRPVGKAEMFVRLTQASTNYIALGEAGFRALTRLVAETPVLALDYPDTATALDLVEQAWAEAR